jgi:hypothetical protein
MARQGRTLEEAQEILAEETLKSFKWLIVAILVAWGLFVWRVIL